MGFATAYRAVNDDAGDFTAQVAYAINRAALDIRNENTNTPNHAARMRWANNVQRSATAAFVEAQRVRWRVANNPTVQAALESTGTASDADITFTVASLINELARG